METESQLVIKHPLVKSSTHCWHSNFANSSPGSKWSGTSMMSSWSPCSWLDASIVLTQIDPFPVEIFTSQSACSYYCLPWSPHPQLITFQLLPCSTIMSSLWDSLSQISCMLPGLFHCILFHPSPLFSVSKFCLPVLPLGHILVNQVYHQAWKILSGHLCVAWILCLWTIHSSPMPSLPPLSRPWPYLPLFALSRPVHAHPESSESLPSTQCQTQTLWPPHVSTNALPNTPTPLRLINALPTQRSFNLSPSLRQVDSRHRHPFPTRRSFDLYSSSRQVDSRQTHSFPTQCLSTFTPLCQSLFLTFHRSCDCGRAKPDHVPPSLDAS